jgi:ABC-type phosphate transport system substrate-binding protein
MKLNKLLFTALALLAMPAWAGDVYVIANKSLSISGADVRDIFVGDKQVAGGTKLVPIDNAALQKDFLDKVVKVDAAKYGSIWTKKGFREGLNPPVVKNGDADVVAAVKATPGAVGYVSSAPAGVTVVQKY